MIANSVLDLIGNTPMVRINKVCSKPGVEIYAKLEGCNPTGGVKDRIALKMIEAAERDGRLTHDKIILEATSGNTGIGLALVAQAKGYRVLFAMSEGVSVERRKMMKAFGGDFVLTPKHLGTDGAIMKVRELLAAEPDKYFNPDQFSNEANKLAHYEGTAQEIWKQTEGRITHFVASLGTSGTLMGIGKALKEKNPNVKIIEAQPELGHGIQGLKNMGEAIVPPIYDPNMMDEHIIIETAPALEAARQIALQEGLIVGMSAGAAMIAVQNVVERLTEGVVVVLFADRGEKYLSTQLFSE